MREYIDQVYNEGFGTTFYCKPIKYINKKIKNKKIIKFLTIIIKIIYTILVVAFGIFMFYYKWPL